MFFGKENFQFPNTNQQSSLNSSVENHERWRKKERHGDKKTETQKKKQQNTKKKLKTCKNIKNMIYLYPKEVYS